MAKIGVFAGDGGGGNEVVDVGLELAKQGHGIDWRVSPENDPNGVIAKAGTVSFDKRGIKYSRALPSHEDKFDLIVIGTSATATALQVVATEFANVHSIPCVHVEDFPGTGNYRKVRETCCPNVMCVVDEFAKEAALNVRPTLDVRVCGKPSYAKEVGPLLRPWETCYAGRKGVRDALGLTEDHFVIVASLGVTFETLLPYMKVITELGNVAKRQTVLLSRIHPKCPEPVKVAAQGLLAESFTRVIDSSAFNLQRAVIAGDVFACTWGSTEQFCATLASVVPLITLDNEETRVELGYVGGIPPLIRAKAGMGFEDREELGDLIRKVADDPEWAKMKFIKGAQNFEPWIAPDATEKIVAVCLEFLGKN